MELCPNATDGAGHDATITATLSGCTLRPPCMTPAMTPVPPKVELPKENVPQPTNLPDAKLQVTVWSELGESELYNNMELESSRYGSNGRWSCPSRSTEVPATALGSSIRGGGRSGSSSPYDESGGRRTGRRRGCTRRRRRRSSCGRRRITSRRGRRSSSSISNPRYGTYRKAERLHHPKAEKDLLRQKEEEHQPPREDQQFYRQPSRLHQQKAEKELQWQKDKDHQPPREEQQCHRQPPIRQ
ncbi:uncharacterized protein LOC110182025 [Drosophila serrata]|uniref:uncharacterized protein LOC110182025 n=1 Tax=Drosophila serrata TaxID=7274 RepID=UPI000A1D017D|nr:uncharacterized protein LOC110182025 [Drosophila serrata]